MNRITFFLLILIAPIMAAAADLPVEFFFKEATFRSAKLSPEGTHMAILVRVEDRKCLAVLDLETNTPRIVARERYDISRFYWVNNERIIYMLESVRDTEGQRVGGVFAVNRDGKRAKVLVHPPWGNEDKGSVNAPWYSYMGRLPHDPNRILVTYNDRSRDHPDVYTMDVNSGRTRRVLLNTHNFRGYYLDVDGEVRFGLQKEKEENETRIFFFHPENKKWELFVTLHDMGVEWYPLDFSLKHDTFLVSTDQGVDRELLMRYNWRTGERELAYADDDYDLADLNWVLHTKDHDRVVGIYYEADKPRSTFFDNGFAHLQRLIDGALPQTFNQIASTSEDGRRLLILSASDRQMPHYYLLKLDEGKLDPLESVTPWIKPEQLVETRPIRFAASDGETIHGYLTLPPQWEEGKRVPLIVLPHGGPWARDTWRLMWYFDLEKQFYANRGFAVLQVNFRGSTGFGKEFYTAHVKNIGRMYADMIEGVEWTVSEGYVDRERIGIAGASWGGYKTMLGLTRDPDLFKFGINLFGAVDIPTQMNRYLSASWDRKEAYEWWRTRMGDPSVPKELAYLNEWSPIHAVEQIKSPVFIYHGVRDLNVDIEQTRMLIAALRRHGKQFVDIINATEMHSIDDEALRIRVYTEIDKFLLPFRQRWGLLSDGEPEM